MEEVRAYQGLSLEIIVDIFARKASDIIALWTTFVSAAALVLACVYGIGQASGHDWPPTMKLAVSVVIAAGYATFAYGHWLLLAQALNVRAAIASDLKKILANTDHDMPFHQSLRSLLMTVDDGKRDAKARERTSRVAHIIIDCCVTFALTYPYLKSLYDSSDALHT